MKSSFFSLFCFVYRNTPKGIKVFIYILFGALIGSIVNQFLIDQIINISAKKFFLILIVILFLFQFALLIGAFSSIKKLLSKQTSKKEIETKNKLSQLPDKIELISNKVDMFEITVFAKRYYKPDEIPDKTIFTNGISFSEPKCFLCKSDIECKMNSYICSNTFCENHTKPTEKNLFSSKIKQLKTLSIADIRKEFNKYWILYCNTYNKLTNRDYDKYSPTLPFYY